MKRYRVSIEKFGISIDAGVYSEKNLMWVIETHISDIDTTTIVVTPI